MLDFPEKRCLGEHVRTGIALHTLLPVENPVVEYNPDEPLGHVILSPKERT